jgi:hypothetical protein
MPWSSRVQVGGEANMEVTIQIALMFFFIQFLVVVAIMVVALLLARPEVPISGREPRPDALRRSFAYTIHLPGRVFCSVVRWMHHMHFVRGVHQ